MTVERNSRPSVLLAGQQVGYQLLLLSRSPLGTFTVLVVPLMLLAALSTLNPSTALRDEGFARYADFLVPAMASFALLNACYINVATSVVTAREKGVLKRLHTSPLPLWAYVAGRTGAAAVVGGVAFWAVLAAGAAFLNVHLDLVRAGYLLAVMAMGACAFAVLAIALSTVVRTTDSALPFAYGTFLPVAFISNVFFPLTRAPEGLKRVSEALPVGAVSGAAEHVFRADGWPMTTGQLVSLLAWAGAGALVAVVRFSWEPGGRRRAG